MDPAGRIFGFVQGAGNVLPICALPYGRFRDGPGLGPLTSSCNFVPNGSYDLAVLGPYIWPVALANGETTFAWSGGGTDRNSATYLKVEAGTTVRHDIVAPPRAQLDVVLPSVEGNPSLTAYHADTGDIVSVHPDRLLPAVPVLLRFATDRGVSCWYVGEPPYGGNPRRPAPPVAKRVTAPGGITLTLDVNCRRDATVPIDWNPNPTKPRPTSLSWGAGVAEGAGGPEGGTADARMVSLRLVRLAIRMAVFGP